MTSPTTCRNKLARDERPGTVVFQMPRVIVDGYREQARSCKYKDFA